MKKAISFYRNSRPEIVGIVALVIVGIGMAWLGWLKWCDPIIDFGRELYIPWALCQGKILYKDISMFFYGPLSYYLNALLFNIFGVHINAIIAFNLMVICLSAGFIYNIVKFVSSAMCAFFSVLFFIVLFAFPRYFPVLNDNFVTPYSHAATHGMVLSFLALFLVLLHLKTKRIGFAYLCWLTTGLVLLTKVEIFAGLLASMVITWLWILRAAKMHPVVKVAHLAAFVSLLMLPLFLAGAFFSRIFTLSEALLRILTPYSLMFHQGHSFSPLLVRVMGLDNPLAYTGRILYWFLIYVLAAFIVIAVNRLLSPLYRNTGRRLLPAALAFLVTMPFINATLTGTIPYLDYFLPLPLVVLLYAAYVITALWKSEPDHIEWKNHIMSLSLAVFSFVLLTRVLFNVRVLHYGFFLVLPGFLILLIVILHKLPAIMHRTGGSARFGMIPVIVVLLCTLYSYFFHSVEQYSLINYPIKSDQEVIKTFDIRYADTGKIIQDAIDKIDAVVQPEETFTAFPEGLMFNYLTRRESPSRYTAFLPTFFSLFHGKILESLQEKPPDFVLLVERSTSEYGYRYFGVDYATEVLDWINTNYVEVSQMGRTPFSGEGFGIVLMKRISP